MKRKLALLLAAVMMLSMLPTTLSAYSSNSVTKSIDASQYTVFYEDGVTGHTGRTNGSVSGYGDVIEYWVDGAYLRIRLQDDGAKNTEFTLTLANAEWFFRGFLIDRSSVGGAAFDGTLAGKYAGVPKDSNNTPGIKTDLNTYLNNAGMGNFAQVVNTNGDIEYKSVNSYTNTEDYKNSVTYPDQTYASKLANGDNDLGTANNYEDISGNKTDGSFTFDVNKGFGYWNGSSKLLRYLRYPDYQKVSSTSSEYYYAEVPYTLEVNAGNKSSATITLLDEVKEGDIINIPLSIRTTESGEYTVRITSSNTIVSTGTLYIGNQTSGRTNTTVADIVTSRTDFYLENLLITETRAGSLKPQGAFELKAPSGYYWALPSFSQNSSYYMEIYISGGGEWLDKSGATNVQTRGLMPNNGTISSENNAISVTYKQPRSSSNYEDTSVLVFNINDKGTYSELVSSVNNRAELTITGLVLLADDDDNVTVGKELSISISDVGDKTAVTDQTIKVAEVADYTITLTRKNDTIPTLISGRMDGRVVYDSGEYDDDLSDDSHKAQIAVFEERIPDAWWSKRTTIFTVPEEVTLMKVRLHNVDNIDNVAEMRSGTNGKTDGYYYNLRERQGLVTVKDNELRLQSLTVTGNSDKKAKFEIQTWLSIAATFEGDIPLVLAATAMTDSGAEDVSCVIAKAIRPVEIETSVTEVKIGYQYSPVADFDIVENVAGALLYGKEVKVTATDNISIDLDIADGFKGYVSDGDLKITNINIGNLLGVNSSRSNRTDHITFDIDRESTTASTISFENVEVKVSRDVPYSNYSNEDDRGINLYAWGSAIAENYYYLRETSSYTKDTNGDFVNGNDYFTVPGINAKYINIATLVNNLEDGFTNIVEVTIGSTTCLINGEEHVLEAAPYISVASNSTMVPLRFVSYALGLSTDAVTWDPATSTATVDAGGSRIVQFVTGETSYKVNGAVIGMTSVDGLPVAAEINNERIFVPFRQLANAFGIKVGWDGATNTATYNSPATNE